MGSPNPSHTRDRRLWKSGASWITHGLHFNDFYVVDCQTDPLQTESCKETAMGFASWMEWWRWNAQDCHSSESRGNHSEKIYDKANSKCFYFFPCIFDVYLFKPIQIENSCGIDLKGTPSDKQKKIPVCLCLCTHNWRLIYSNCVFTGAQYCWAFEEAAFIRAKLHAFKHRGHNGALRKSCLSCAWC